MNKKLWGGRFSKKTDPLVEEFTKSIQYDYKLAEYDLVGSIAHVEILKKGGYLTAGEASKLTRGLAFIMKSVKNGSFKPDYKTEDIHTNIQNLLSAKMGDLALKLHTARSRNEQVAFATKLYCKKMIENVTRAIEALDLSLEKLADKNKGLVLPGFTHLQHAQPVYLKNYLAAYGKMLERDIARLTEISIDIKFTMGAGALAGTPIDAAKYKLMAGKIRIETTDSSVDAVSDRDFVVEILAALAILGMHLSRLAEDLIVWSTKEFDFVEIDDSFCTGSSLMPHKKNPDVLELARGYTGRLYGNLISVLTTMKGLPLAYNRDMQLDKEPLFNSFEIVSGELEVLTGLIKTVRFNKAKIEEQLEDESLYATDLVYHLVNKGVPFKTAHTIVGRLIKYCLDNEIEIKSMTDKELKKFSDKFVRSDILKLFNPKLSVESKRSVRRG